MLFSIMILYVMGSSYTNIIEIKVIAILQIQSSFQIKTITNAVAVFREYLYSFYLL